MRWLWLGALVMAIGGFLAIADRRYRIRETAREPRPVADAPKGGAEVLS